MKTTGVILPVAAASLAVLAASLFFFGRRLLSAINDLRKLVYFYFITTPVLGPGNKRMPGPGPLVDTRYSRFQYRTRVTEEYAEKYGKVYLVYNDTLPELVLADPKAIKMYFHNDGRVHRKNFGLGLGYYFHRLLGNAVGTMHNENWFRVRKVVDPHFTQGVVRAMLPNLSGDFQEWFAKLDKHPKGKLLDGSDKGSFSIDILNISERTPFKVVCRALFDPVLTDDDVDRLLKLNDIHAKLVETAFLGNIEQHWWYRYLPTAANRRMDEWDNSWDKICIELVQRSRAEGCPSPIALMYEAVEEGRMTRFELFQTIDEILYTNIDVTSTTLGWALIMMSQSSKHPNSYASNKDTLYYQDRVRDEMRKALYSDDPKWGAGLSEEDRICNYIYRQDTLIHGCVLEAMRLVPLLFYSLPEVTAEAKIINDYRIPANTSVLIDAATLNRQSPCWAPDGDSYRPERFLELDPLEYRYALWRFGLGPRKCVGQFFADRIVKGFLFHALRNHKYELDAPVEKVLGIFVQTPTCPVVVTPIERV